MADPRAYWCTRCKMPWPYLGTMPAECEACGTTKIQDRGETGGMACLHRDYVRSNIDEVLKRAGGSYRKAFFLMANETGYFQVVASMQEIWPDVHEAEAHITGERVAQANLRGAKS